MIRRPFFHVSTPGLKYPKTDVGTVNAIREIPRPRKVSLLLSPDLKREELLIKVGDGVKTGQRLKLSDGAKDYLISTVTGTLSEISEYKGYMGRIYPSVTIEVPGEDEWDDGFGTADETPDSEKAVAFFDYLPGKPDFTTLSSVQCAINAIVIKGFDSDLLVSTNQLVVKTECERLTEGIEHLKKITHVSRVFIVVPPELADLAEETGVPVYPVKQVYPDTLPQIITKKIFGREVPPGNNCEDMGIGFINAETVAALTTAFSEGKIPVDKIVTVINKEGVCEAVRARIGTPVKDIFNALDIEVAHGDQIIFGGPMTGTAVYSQDMPVLPDTDAVMIQDSARIVTGSDNQCVNCGECVRACPAGVPVNMLVRLLGNGLYEEAAEEYDLFSCIECGLCSYVCIAQIPVFHYIMLGKYEFDRIKKAEEFNA